jgi:hypothetical protein
VKRWILRILVCLILGAITTVAVAWAVTNLFAERHLVTVFSAEGVTYQYHQPDGSTQGWPMRALSERLPPYGHRAAPSAIEFKNIVLATGPLWPGFLVDTILYAATWFAICFGRAPAKRFIRTKRGRCPQCGYDLRGALEKGCSECGWGRIPWKGD